MTIGNFQGDPPVINMLLTAKVAIGFDVTAQLVDPGDTIENVEITLYDKNTNKIVEAFESNPTVNGNVIVQVFDGSILSANHGYRVTVTFQSNAENWPSFQETINAFAAP